MGTRGYARRRDFVYAFLFVICCLTVSSSASPQFSELIDAGITHLQAGRADVALKFFIDATHEDPNDSEAALFAGVALNRLGRAQEALSQLSTARRLGSHHPDLSFESGWSLLGLRRWQEAVDQLKSYEARNPGRAQTSEFLGRAYLALGNYQEADAAFTEALKRDPDLLPTVSVYRALLHQRQGNESAARDEIAGLLRAAPASPLTQLLGSQLQPIGSRITSSRPWRLSLQTAIGYNTDARGFDLITPANPGDPVPTRNSAFARVGLDAGCAFVNTANDRLSVGYALLADSYTRQEGDPDVLDQTLSLEYWRALGDHFTTTWRVWDNYTFVGEDEFRNEIAGQASLAARLAKTLFLEASYRYAFDNYLFDTPSVLNRDAQAHTLTMAAELAILQINSRLRGGYFHTWNFARGDDFDYESNGLFAGLNCTLPWKITGEAFYVHNLDRYKDLNSATKPTRFKRRDEIDGVTIRVSRPLTSKVDIYIEYNFNRDDSNIRGYDYEQHITSGGLVWQF